VFTPLSKRGRFVGNISALSRRRELPLAASRKPSGLFAFIFLAAWKTVASGPSYTPSRSGTFKELRDGRDEAGHVDGLALVPVEPGGHDLLPVLAHHRGGHGHDGNPPRGLLGSEPSERLDPVNPREPNVHQDQARAPFLGQPDALFARLALDDLIPFEGQHVPDELPVLVVVLDDQDARADQGRTGSRKVKVDPAPTALATQIVPPCSSTNFRQRVSPSPVPSCFAALVPT